MNIENRRNREQIAVDHLIDTVTVMILIFSGTYGFWALQSLPMIAGV